MMVMVMVMVITDGDGGGDGNGDELTIILYICMFSNSISFLNTDMGQVIEIVPLGQGPSHITVIAMTAFDLVTQGYRASAAIVYWHSNLRIPLFEIVPNCQPTSDNKWPELINFSCILNLILWPGLGRVLNIRVQVLENQHSSTIFFSLFRFIILGKMSTRVVLAPALLMTGLTTHFSALISFPGSSRKN